MELFREFMNEYATTILYAIVTAIAGYIGIVLKNIYQKYVNDKTKKAVAKTVVNAVEQLYKDLHGQEKYDKAVEAMSQMLSDKGITISDIEIKMLIEAAVAEFNGVFDGADESGSIDDNSAASEQAT